MGPIGALCGLGLSIRTPRWPFGAASVGTGWEPAQEALGNDSSRVSESTELFERDVSDMMRAGMIRVL